MSKPLSIRIGNFLYKQVFPIYNLIYPVFKNKQDAEEINYLKKNIKPGDVIIDIGANIGFYTKLLSSLIGPNGKVHAFEPDNQNFKHLSKNVKSLQNVILNKKAVSDSTGNIKIYKSKDLNVDHRTYPVEDYASIETIESISIDDYLNSNYKVDIIKMDIQGYEISALKGMKETIRFNKDIKLLLELWPFGLHQAGASVAQFYDVICSLNLKIQFLEKNKLIAFEKNKIDEYETWGWGTYKNIVISSL